MTGKLNVLNNILVTKYYLDVQPSKANIRYKYWWKNTIFEVVCQQFEGMPVFKGQTH